MSDSEPTKPGLVAGEALVLFGSRVPASLRGKEFSVVIADAAFKSAIEDSGANFKDITSLTGPGSVQEAGAFAEELSGLTLPSGERVSSWRSYRGYDLWWVHYNSLIHFYALPYTQHKKLLTYLTRFRTVHLYGSDCSQLFVYHGAAHGQKVVVHGHRPRLLQAGILLQGLLTLISVPVLMLTRKAYLVFTGDKFEEGKDYDVRFSDIYHELRTRRLPFVEFVRSLEPWHKVLRNAVRRKRPVIYPEAVRSLASVFAMVTGGRARIARAIDAVCASENDTEKRFKLLVATHYLRAFDDYRWATRFMRIILQLTGVKSAFITAMSERSASTVIACKLLKIPTVGIMHGVSTPNSTGYDFMPGFKSPHKISVDQYGVWSDWWRDYFVQRGDAYTPEQLVVSGPMRPLKISTESHAKTGGPLSVLFISEQRAEPEEIMPYLRAVLAEKDFACTLKFRSYRDGFEMWLEAHAPDVLAHPGINIVRGDMQAAIKEADVVVGSHSTAVLEALLQLKPFLLCMTKKWGDFFELETYPETKSFIAQTPAALVAQIREAHKVEPSALMALQTRFFGDPRRNGSAWVINQLESHAQ